MIGCRAQPSHIRADYAKEFRPEVGVVNHFRRRHEAQLDLAAFQSNADRVVHYFFRIGAISIVACPPSFAVIYQPETSQNSPGINLSLSICLYSINRTYHRAKKLKRRLFQLE
jgi:hypothetical protein